MFRRIREISFTKIAIIVLTVATLLVASTYAVFLHTDNRNARQTCDVLLRQICDIIDSNSESEKLLLQSLKEEYIIRATTVSHMIDNQPSAETSVKKLREMAKLMSIDEIHIFDKTGKIYAGSVPKYYGYSFDSGKQMSYFKPMLKDKNLSMCQDVTPNTAEKKKMMYAITWNSAGDKMIQVGIEPKRLLEALKNNEITNVVARMPSYSNTEIFVASSYDGEILASTTDSAGKTLNQIGISTDNLKDGEICESHASVNGTESICSLIKYDRYIICVSQTVVGIHKATALPMAVIIICIMIAVAIILFIIRKLLIIQKDQIDQLMVLTSMSGIYSSIHLLDIRNNTFTEYVASNTITQILKSSEEYSASAAMKAILCDTISEDYLQIGLDFVDFSTIAARLAGRKVIYTDLLSRHAGWVRVSFIVINRDSLDNAQKVICTTQVIDEEKRKEEELIKQSTTDRLTHCFNRREYENDLLSCNDITLSNDFIYVVMDINGLKSVNDTLGHDVGDELIKGAAECISRCFGANGKTYRLGGDEFVALIYASEHEFEEIKADFEESVSDWSGTKSLNLSVSYGYATKREFTDLSVSELSKIADSRMYDAKEKYYTESGIDRRRR